MLRIEHFPESLAIQLWYRPLSSLPAVSIASGYFRDVTRDQLTQFPQGAVLRHGQLGHVRDQHVSRQKGLTFICEVRLQDNNKNNSNNKLLSLEKKFVQWVLMTSHYVEFFQGVRFPSPEQVRQNRQSCRRSKETSALTTGSIICL